MGVLRPHADAAAGAHLLLGTVGPVERVSRGGVVVPCRCEVLNVLSGEVARDYLRTHLERDRLDGMGRTVHRCEESGLEWVEDRSGTGYGDDVTVLRRLTR
jgi:hypothetical protein